VQSNARFSLRMIRPFGGFAGMTYAEFFGRPEPYNSAFQEKTGHGRENFAIVGVISLFEA
jgi:hypothetical protein